MFGTETIQRTEPARQVPGCVADAVEALHKAAGADLSLVAEVELYELAGTGAALRSVGQTVEALALAELDRRGTTTREHGLCTAKWHAARTGTPMRAVNDTIKVGDHLSGRFGKLRDALADGQLNYTHARKLADTVDEHIIDGLAAEQDRIIAAATEASSIERWGEDLRARAERLRATSEHDPQMDPTSNRLRFSRRRSTGLLGIDTDLTDELGVVTQHLIEAEADRRFHAAVKAHGQDPTVVVPKREQLLAEAQAALIRRGAGMDLASSEKPRTEAILIIRSEDTDLEHVTTPDGRYVHPVIAGVHACDALWHAMVVNDQGHPLWVGRQFREATPAQRKALIIRDGGCVMPGCHAPPSWCDAHHVIWWERGGRTDIDNLALVCRSCHGKIHSGRFKLQTDGNGGFTVTYPDGHTEPTQHQPPPPAHEPPRRRPKKRRRRPAQRHA